MKNNSVHGNIVKAGVSVLLCLLLIVSSLPTVITARNTSGKAASSLDSVSPVAKIGDVADKETISALSFSFTVQMPKIDISDVAGDDGRTYQKLTMPDSVSMSDDVGGPQIPYLIKNVHIPDNAKDVTVQVQTDGAPTVYHDILVYPCPKSIVKTDDGGNTYLAEEFCFDEKKYAGEQSVPGKQVEIAEDGYFRSVRMVSLNVYPVSYVPSLRTVEVANSMTITVQWSVNQTVKAKRDTTKGFEKMITQVAMNYEKKNGVSQKTQSATRGSAVFITGSQLRDTTTVCDYLVITHPDFFSSTVLADFVNYRAVYSNLNVVVVQTSDIYTQFPEALGQDYSIKDFMQFTYDHWQTSPQYLLIVGNKQHVPSHQTQYVSGIMDDEKWYVCLSGGDEWADMAMGRFSVENGNELQSIYNKIVYYEQYQYSDKPSLKKAVVAQGGCVSGEPVYNTVFNAGFNTTYINKFYEGTNQDIITAINKGQDIVSYTGHGGSYSWEIFSTSDLPHLTNTIFPIVLTTACSTADLDYESLGEQFVNIENKGAVAYYGATYLSSLSPAHKILAEMFDNGEFHLGKAVMYGEFMWHPEYIWLEKTYILLGDPALQSFGYPENNNNLPDLTVSSSGVNYDYSTQRLTITVSNKGAVDASNVLVNVVIIDENSGKNILLGSHVFDVVPAGGETQSVTVSNIVPPITGDYSVVAIVDPDNAIQESFKMNNYNGRRMTVSPTFVDVTSQSGLQNIPTAQRVIVHADINNDGYQDIYITGVNAYSYLYLNNHDGIFTDITSQAGVRCWNSDGAVFGDVDNDGNPDLYVCIPSGNGDHLFHGRGDGTFEERTQVSGLSGHASDEAIFGDVNNDGYLDLLIITHKPPHVVLFINDGDGTFTDETSIRGLNNLNSGEYVNCPKFTDIDNDGDVDLLIEHYYNNDFDFSSIDYYRNDGSGHFILETLSDKGSSRNPYLFFQKFDISDINNDGNLDVIFDEAASRVLFLIQNDNHSFTTNKDSIFSRLEMQGHEPLFLAEIDNVAGDDLLSERGFPDRPPTWILLRNSGKTIFKNYEYYMGKKSSSGYSAPNVFDLDNDGDNDIILGETLYNYVPIVVLQNQVNNQNWLDVKPIGVISNHDAIGAKVYVFSNQGELVGFQEVSSQRSVPIHFGVDSPKTYVVLIYWPASDKWDVVDGVAPGQLITCVEGSTSPTRVFADAHGPYAELVGKEIHFTGSVFGGVKPYNWSWDFGDGNTLNGSNPSHRYVQSGTYAITLTITDSQGKNDSDTATATIIETEPLQVYTNGPCTGIGGNPILFIGSAIGGVPPYNWSWDFGDGNTSNEQNPVHYYNASGEYTVILTVIDSIGIIGQSTVHVTIAEPLIVTANGPNTGISGVLIQFTGSAIGGVPPYIWCWDFGEGTYSFEQNAQHTYNLLKTYTVLLTVVDDHNNWASDTVTVTIELPSPLITTYGPYSGIANESNQFDAYIQGGIRPYTCDWDFGDGNTSTLSNQYSFSSLNHTYSAVGIYTITLTATDAHGASATNTTTATITTEPTSLIITANGPYIGSAGFPIQFTGSATGGVSPYNYFWNFGDGHVSWQPKPTHTYTTAGVYPVTLKVTDIHGTSTTDTTSATITTDLPPPLLVTANGPYIGLAGFPIQFTGSAIGGVKPYTWSWNFGDGYASFEPNPTHTYTTAGVYSVTLKVTDIHGTSTTNTTKAATITTDIPLPLLVTANGPYIGLAGFPIQFTGSAIGGVKPYTWSWDFGDGNTSNEQNSVHCYHASGKYTTILMVTDSEGTIGKDTTNVLIFTLSLIIDIHGPYVGFVNTPVSFTSSVTGGVPPYSYTWDFGDGSNSNIQNPTHTYNAAGVYTVTLTVTDAQGTAATNTTTATITAKPLIVNINGPYTKFAGYPTNFNGAATGGILPYNWNWNFGDGNNSNIQNPTHTYNAAGVYTVTLTVTDAQGTSATNTTTVTITALPPLKANAYGPYYGFVNVPVQFTGSATGGYYFFPYEYSWNFGDGKSTLYEQNPTHIYTIANTYTVTLTVTDYFGITSSTTTTAVILPSVTIHNINKDTYYGTIQAAINDADPGNTILVGSGTYNEHLTINKQITLIGADRNTTIISSTSENNIVAVEITADNVSLSGFTIQNQESNGREVIHITSNATKITGNIIKEYAQWKPCMKLDHSHDTIISENTLDLRNIIAIGIDLSMSSNNTISRNMIKNGMVWGILLRDSSDNNIISRNTITHQWVGIEIFDGTNNSIYQNDITNNDIGLETQYSQVQPTNNKIYQNNFNNNQNANDPNNNIWYNALRKEGNYWSDYTGSDQNNDGIGDTPYNIPGKTPPNQDLYPLTHSFKLGDMNLDGRVTYADIDPWVLALNPVAYQNQYHIRATLHGDINQDGKVTFADIDPFVQLLNNDN